jgi:hypothetical protein
MTSVFTEFYVRISPACPIKLLKKRLSSEETVLVVTLTQSVPKVKLNYHQNANEAEVEVD